MEKLGKFLLKDEKGQSAVEYIMLLAVIVSLSFTVFNNKIFLKYMGPDSAYFGAIRSYLGYSYRYGLPGAEDKEDFNSYERAHPSYVNELSGQTRYFFPLEAYPQ